MTRMTSGSSEFASHISLRSAKASCRCSPFSHELSSLEPWPAASHCCQMAMSSQCCQLTMTSHCCQLPAMARRARLALTKISTEAAHVGLEQASVINEVAVCADTITDGT